MHVIVFTCLYFGLIFSRSITKSNSFTRRRWTDRVGLWVKVFKISKRYLSMLSFAFSTVLGAYQRFQFAWLYSIWRWYCIFQSQEWFSSKPSVKKPTVKNGGPVHVHRGCSTAKKCICFDLHWQRGQGHSAFSYEIHPSLTVLPGFANGNISVCASG